MGILFWGMTIYWLHLVTGLGLFLLLPYLGIYFAVFGWCLGYIYIMKKGNLAFLLGPLFWIVLEMIRGSLLGGFPWLILAHGQYLNIPLLQWASLGGEGTISGIIILVNLIITAVFFSRGKKQLGLIIALSGILTFTHIGGWILLKNNSRGKDSLRIAVIQPNITLEKWDERSLKKNFKTLLDLSYKSLQGTPGLIIWPETSCSYDFEKERTYLEALKEFSRGHGCYLLVGTIRETGGGNYYNSAILISPETKTSSYDKVILVPFGEYVPLGDKFPAFKRWAEKISGYRFSFVPGEKADNLFIGKVPFGVLICFEDIFPWLSRHFKKNGARFLVNMTDDHWFGRTSAPYQHLAASVLRAVENRLPLIRSASTGVSAFIDSSGRIINTVRDIRGRTIFVRGLSIKEISLK